MRVLASNFFFSLEKLLIAASHLRSVKGAAGACERSPQVVQACRKHSSELAWLSSLNPRVSDDQTHTPIGLLSP